MIILYTSMTGNVGRFCEKVTRQTGWDTLDFRHIERIDQPYILITYTTGFGEVPPETTAFLNAHKHNKWLQGVAVSGNRNWGDNFGKAGDILSKKYNVPLLLKFELSGTNNNVQTFINEVGKLEQKLFRFQRKNV